MVQKIRSAINKFTIQDWIFMVFSILWIAIIVVDYLNKQIVYGPSFRHFRYFRLFGVFTLVGFGLSAYYNGLKPFDKWPKLRINGIVILALIIGIIWAITISFSKYWQAPLTSTNYMHLAGMTIFTLGGTLILVGALYGIGKFLRQMLLRVDKKTPTFLLLDISLGFVLYTFIMMLLGVFHLLHPILLLVIILLLGLINYKDVVWFFKKVVWSKIKKPKDFNIWGGAIAFFSLVYLTMNYLYTQAPFPLGFDARNYYVNISNLIADSGSLIEGYQPYAWSLVMSTGYIVFNSPEITFFISTLGGILALFATYEISYRYLRVNSNFSWLVVLLIMVSPTIATHWIIEFKVDLALLFFQLTILNLVMWWVFVTKKSKKEVIPLLKTRQDYNVLIIIGILFGYGLSIKVLSIFLVYALFLALWYYSKDLIGTMGVALLGVGAILCAGLDQISGLRNYHLSPNETGLVCIIIGLSCLGYSVYQNRNQFVNNSKVLILCTGIMVLTFSPWVYKNYAYTKSTSIIKLMIGEKPKPNIFNQGKRQDQKKS